MEASSGIISITVGVIVLAVAFFIAVHRAHERCEQCEDMQENFDERLSRLEADRH